MGQGQQKSQEGNLHVLAILSVYPSMCHDCMTWRQWSPRTWLASQGRNLLASGEWTLERQSGGLLCSLLDERFWRESVEEKAFMTLSGSRLAARCLGFDFCFRNIFSCLSVLQMEANSPLWQLKHKSPSECVRTEEKVSLENRHKRKKRNRFLLTTESGQY